MNTSVTEAEIARYLAGMRAALADLPGDVCDELLEDEPAHLAEVLAEGNGTLEQRLGSPEAYATELRTAAGVAAPPSGGPTPKASAALVRLRSGVRGADLAIGPIFGYERAAELLKLLRPGWWVLRGYLAGLVILVAFGGRDLAGFLPFASREAWAWLVVVGVSVVASVRLGQLMPRLRQWHRWVVGAAGVFVVFLALAGLNWSPQPYYEGTPAYYDPYSGVSDIYPYDKDGHPLSDVRLIDQNGTPLQVGDPWRCADKQQVMYSSDGQPWTMDQKLNGYRYPLCPPGGWRPGEALPSASPAPSPAPSTAPSPQPTR
jgi:hypothetical protein